MRYLFLLLFVSTFACAQNNDKPGISIFERNLKKDSVIKDLSTLYYLLNTVHPGQFIYCSKTAFDKCYDSLSKSIQTDLTALEFYTKASCLVSKIRDGHMYVDDSGIRKQVKIKLVIPFSVYKIKDTFYINKVAVPGYNYLIGNAVSTINGQPLREIVSASEVYMSLEGENETGMNPSLQLFPYYYYLLDSSPVFKINYTDSLGISQTASLEGIEYDVYRKNTRKIVNVIEQEFTKENIAILTVNTFSKEDFEYYKIDYKRYIDAFFKKVRKRKIAKLIIDVRGNGGGASEISNYLFSFLIDKPYYYIESICRKYKTTEWKKLCLTPQFIDDLDSAKTPRSGNLYYESANGNKWDYWWYKQQKPQKHPFKGELITLTDPACFSSTGHFVALLKYNHTGRIFGECTQGNYHCSSSGLPFQLPYSKLVVRIPLARFKMRMPEFNYDPKGICPDVVITKAPQDLKTGFDRTLNAAVNELLKK